MKPIVGMGKEELLGLPANSELVLTKDDLLHIFQVFNGFWSYDREALDAGKPGLHAELKSGKCSDGFFYSKIVLQHRNLRRIIAWNLVRHYQLQGLGKPDYVAGIPKGATELGEDVADIFGVPVLPMKKDEHGKIMLVEEGDENFIWLKAPLNKKNQPTLLLVEDFCSLGTGFAEAVRKMKGGYEYLNILPIELVILNRGGIEYIPVGEHGFFDVMALVEHQINSWDQDTCPLCQAGSERIKPKAIDKNWELLVGSQN